MEKFNHILTGTASNVLGSILMFLTTIYLTRTFDPEVYGEFRLIFSFVSLAALLLLFGRASTIIYSAQRQHRNKKIIIKEEIVFGLITLLVGSFFIFLFSDFVKTYLFRDINIQYLNIALVMIPLWGLFNLMISGLKAVGHINYSFVLSNFVQRLIRIPFRIMAWST